MKTLTLSLLIVTSTTLFANELSWVDQQVEAIKPPREGMKSNALLQLKDPFIFLINKDDTQTKTIKSTPVKSSTNQTKRKVQDIIKATKILTLQAIMNSSVLISDKWYKLGDNVNGYKIAEVNRTSVLLKKKKKELLLTTQSSSKKLNFKNN